MRGRRGVDEVKSLKRKNWLAGEGGAFPVTLLVLQPRRHRPFRLFPKRFPTSPGFWSSFTFLPSGFVICFDLANGFQISDCSHAAAQVLGCPRVSLERRDRIVANGTLPSTTDL